MRSCAVGHGRISRAGFKVGPDDDGTIPVIMQDRLIAIGDWLAVNGESVYGTRKSIFKKLPWGVSTTKGNTIYLQVFNWPEDHTLEVAGLATKVTKATLLHDQAGKPLKVTKGDDGTLTIDLMGYHPFEHASVVKLELAGKPVVTDSITP